MPGRPRSAARLPIAITSRAPYYATPGDGIFHFYFPEQGLVMPGQFIPGADSHSRAYGAYGAVGLGVGSTTLGFGWATGYVYFTLAKARRVVFAGRLQPWVSGKDIVLELLRRWGTAQAQGMSVELVDAKRQLPIAYRNTIANMMAEAEAQNGIFAPDEITQAWYQAKGFSALPYPLLSPGEDAAYEIDEALDLSTVRPMIAKPFSPGNAFDADAVARERVTFDKAMIGSCTNGSYDDLLTAALVVRSARRARLDRAASPLVVFPGRAVSPGRSSGRTRGSAASRWPMCSGRLAAEIRAVVVRSVLRAGSGRASARVNAPSPRSTATGRTAWASAAKATLRARPSWWRRLSQATWRRPKSSGFGWDPERYRCLIRGTTRSRPVV